MLVLLYKLDLHQHKSTLVKREDNSFKRVSKLAVDDGTGISCSVYRVQSFLVIHSAVYQSTLRHTSQHLSVKILYKMYRLVSQLWIDSCRSHQQQRRQSGYRSTASQRKIFSFLQSQLESSKRNGVVSIFHTIDHVNTKYMSYRPGKESHHTAEVKKMSRKSTREHNNTSINLICVCTVHVLTRCSCV